MKGKKRTSRWPEGLIESEKRNFGEYIYNVMRMIKIKRHTADWGW